MIYRLFIHKISLKSVHNFFRYPAEIQKSGVTPVPGSGLWSGSGSKVNQFVHAPTSVDTQNFIQIHPRVFWVILHTDRQTNERGRKHILPPLSDVNKQLLPDRTNLAPHPLAGCCHLADLIAWFHYHCQSTLCSKKHVTTFSMISWSRTVRL